MEVEEIMAWEGLVDRARVCADQTVLVYPGAGGIGHVTVQLARAYGARVTSPSALLDVGKLPISRLLGSIVSQ